MITENLSTLKIHKLTQAQYDRELAAGRIDESALYLTPDEEIVFPVDSVNGKTGEVTLSASDVGAIPQQCSYVSTAVSADTITEPFVLLNISSENAELRSLLGNANYAYLQTQYYHSNPGYRMQVAHSYGINPAKMAFRTEYQGVWSAWTSPSASDTPTYPYVVSETTTSNLLMYQQQATNPSNTLATYYFDYTCRKWSNGVIEIFGHSKGSTTGALDYVKTTTGKSWGTLYETGVFLLPNYPETLKTCTYANVSFASITGDAVWAEGGHWSNLTGLGNVYFCRATVGATGLDDVQGNVCTYTVGTWK